MNLFQIIQKIHAGAILSSAERDFLSSLFLTEDGKLRFSKALEAHWNSFETTLAELDMDEILEKVHQQMGDRKGAKRSSVGLFLRYSLACAAALLVGLMASLFLQDKSIPLVAPSEASAKIEMYNPKGLRTLITLPDSSKVTLNGDTHISYTYNFESSTRMVHLEGEAFFEVHRDEVRPFIVEANEAVLTVLGTSFNVRAYPDHNSVDATLMEGSLKVRVGDTENFLKPGQQINIRESMITQKAHDIDVFPVMAWMDGKLQVQSISFAEFAVVLERAFNVNIYIRNEGLRNKKFTGKFDNGENLDQIFQVMQASVPFRVVYDKEINTLIIR